MQCVRLVRTGVRAGNSEREQRQLLRVVGVDRRRS